MTLAKDVVRIECDIKHETEKAILIVAHNTDGEVIKEWFPLSQIHEIHRQTIAEKTGLYEDAVVMNKWIATKKGLV